METALPRHDDSALEPAERLDTHSPVLPTSTPANQPAIAKAPRRGKMNLVRKLYQRSVLERIAEIDWDAGSDNPYVVELDPTTACDLACPGCISGDLLNQKGFDKRFSNDRLMEIVDELIDGGVKAVILIGGGEPLSHPLIRDVINRLGENDVQIGITTNGTLIDRSLDAIARYAGWTRVSVDAGSDDTFRALRPTARGDSKFNKVIANMRQLAEVKQGILGYSFLVRTEADGDGDAVAGRANWGKVNSSNVGEIYAAAALAKDIGCDYFEVKPSYDDDHNLVTHSPGDMAVAAEQLERARALNDETFRVIESVNMGAALEREQIGDQPKSYCKCPAAELRTLVTPSGVYVCPYFRGDPYKRIGDLRTESLSEMWHGERRKQVMQKLDPGKDCAKLHCIRHDTNQAVMDIAARLRDGETVSPIDSEREDRFI